MSVGDKVECHICGGDRDVNAYCNATEACRAFQESESARLHALIFGVQR